MFRQIINSADELLAALNKIKGTVYNFNPAIKHELIYKIYDEPRTTAQNRYLWGWVYSQISDQLNEGGIVIPCDDGTEIPYTKDILHEYVFGRKFRIKEEYIVRGKPVYRFESTSKMGKKRFMEYLEQVEHFTWQYWEIKVPHPCDDYYANLLKQIKT